MKYWVECWKKYAVFTGRARRKEYWMFFLFNALLQLSVGFVLGLVLGLGGMGDSAEAVGNAVGILYSLAALLPGLGVTCRRLHDTGKSGWCFLLVLVPIVGAIIFLVFMCSDSQPGVNEYGANPKE